MALGLVWGQLECPHITQHDLPGLVLMSPAFLRCCLLLAKDSWPRTGLLAHRASSCLNWSPVLATGGSKAGEGLPLLGTGERWLPTTPRCILSPSPDCFPLRVCGNSLGVCVVTRQTAWVKHAQPCCQKRFLPFPGCPGTLGPLAVCSWDFSGFFYPVNFNSVTARRNRDWVITLFTWKIFLKIPPAAAICPARMASQPSHHPVLCLFSFSQPPLLPSPGGISQGGPFPPGFIMLCFLLVFFCHP